MAYLKQNAIKVIEIHDLDDFQTMANELIEQGWQLKECNIRFAVFVAAEILLEYEKTSGGNIYRGEAGNW